MGEAYFRKKHFAKEAKGRKNAKKKGAVKPALHPPGGTALRAEAHGAAHLELPLGSRAPFTLAFPSSLRVLRDLFSQNPQEVSHVA